jgi:hypothetical protein
VSTDRHTDRPGKEISAEHREVAEHLIDNEGWRYCDCGNRYPKLYPPDGRIIKVPKTGHTQGCAFKNWVALIRRNGGHWPPIDLEKQEPEEEE